MKLLFPLLLLASPLLAYEPQFVIPDATIDQNFKNAAAELKKVDEDLAAVITSTGTLAVLSSTQTFTGENTFGGWVDIGWERIVVSGSQAVTANCTTGKKVLGGGCDWADLGVTHMSSPALFTSSVACTSPSVVAVTTYAICVRIK